MVICFFTPNPPSFFVCVCVCFMAMLLKPRRFIFPLVGLILGVWQRCVRTRIEWLGWLRIADPLHPVPVSLVDLKILCGVITGLKWGEKTHTLSRSGPTFVQKLCKTRKCICPLLVQRHRWAFAAGRSTSPALQWLQSDHRRCVIYTSCFIVKLPIGTLPSVSFLFQGV